MDDNERKQIVKAMSMMSQIGLTAIVCIVMGLVVGLGLDGLLGTAPVFLIIFSILGIISALKAMIEVAKKF